MLKMVDGTGIIGVDMICPLGVSTPQPPNYDRVELEGTGVLVLPNSLDAPLERLELGGKTEQVQTSGKNLFDFSNLESGRINISTGALEEHNHTRRLADYIDITDITSYSIYLPGYNKANGAVYVIIYYYDKDKNYLSYKPCGDKIEKYENITPVENAVYIKVTLEQNTIDNPQNIFKVQLEKGAKSTDYEPYTGGKPSPSQEYQQEIKNVGKWNEGTQKYEVSVKVTGKNLLNLQKEPDVNGLYKGWKVGNGDKGTLSIKDKGNNADISECYFGLNSDGTTSNSVTWLVDNGVIKRYHIESIEKMYACMYPPNEKIIKKITERFEIQYEYGSIATEYEPYKEQSLTITSDRPITKWDRLVEQGGEIGWLYQSEIDADVRPSRIDLFPYGFNLYKNHENGTHTYNVTNIKKAIGFQTSYCKQFKNKDAAYQSAEMWHYSDQPSMKTQYFNTDIPTREEFIEWMESNPLTMVYKTEKTEFVPLPQEEQDAIRALKAYYPTTVITVDGGELDPDIKATYRKEI